MNLTVSLEVAKRLAPYYPQDQFPQLVWVLPRLHPGEVSGPMLLVWAEHRNELAAAMERDIVLWLAAPSHLQAFEWLEEKGYKWNRDYETGLYSTLIPVLALVEGRLYGDTGKRWLAFLRTPDDLIIACCKHLQEKTGDAM